MTDGAVGLDDLHGWLGEFARLVHENRDMLTQLDSAIGDADHGINMDRGMTAVIEAIAAAELPTVAALFQKVGMTLVTTVGGASGPLYGTFFLRFGTNAGDATSLSPTELAAALRAGQEGVVARGKPELGDKTMYDAMSPAMDACDAALAEGADLGEALARASQAAADGRDATIPMQARKGRASYLGERSVGHQDPGATSTALLFQAAADTLG
jgi:dihydroxyacetone kinase-like protein